MKVNRVEIISKKEGREKVVRAEDIELSFQDDGRTLKIFYGYSDNNEDIECTGNNGNGYFLDSCGHNCGCKGIKIITNKTETNV
jgi:hypothetical protein